MENSELSTVSENVNKAWRLMMSKGLTHSERMSVRTAITKFAILNNPNIEETDGFFKHKSIIGYGFNTIEEAELAGAMAKAFPKADPEKLMTAFSLVMKLFDADSTWAWKSTK